MSTHSLIWCSRLIPGSISELQDKHLKTGLSLFDADQGVVVELHTRQRI